MKIELKRINDAVHFEALNESGVRIAIDGSPAIGGENKGARPMELLIMGLGGCSGIDIINILKKMKQDVDDFSISIDAEREQGKEPSLFEKIHIQFQLTGALDTSKVEKAVQLSMDKYCSVAKTLEKTATITYGFSIQPALK
jgi:putative redox protein